MSIRRFRVSALILLFFASLLFSGQSLQAAPKKSPLPSKLDAAAARVMKAFEVPGLGLAVVKDGRVVVAKGYGLKKLGEAAPVDSQTLFGIASNTKVFTAAALGLLVDEGKIAWDDPVVSILPAFQMFDPYVTRELTVRDLLVHRSGLGLGAGDLLWWPPTTYDRKEIARRLRFIRPATSFRSAYAYDNVLYLVAGELIEAVSGKATWPRPMPGWKASSGRSSLSAATIQIRRAGSCPMRRIWPSGCWFFSTRGVWPTGRSFFLKRRPGR